MTTEIAGHHHENLCLMCAVRALTEGEPEVWVPETPGESVSGVVLRQGTVDERFGTVPFVDLWRGGRNRIRIVAYPRMLREALNRAEVQVGDTLTVWFDGKRTIELGPRAGQMYKSFSSNVQRGHR
jgi:hypothetical protein